MTDEEIKQIRQIVLDVLQEQKKFEEEQYDDDWEDEREYDEDDFDEYDGRYNCKCGAWQTSNTGKLIHIADCCCGAE